MDNQEKTVETKEKKTIPGNLKLPILAICLAAGGPICHLAISVLLPHIISFVNLFLGLLGLIPIIGIPFNLLSSLLSGVSFFISLLNPLIWIVAVVAAIAGIVVGIMALVKLRASANDENTKKGKVLSTLAIVIGFLAIFAMLIMLVISIISTMISLAFSVLWFVLNIASMFIG